MWPQHSPPVRQRAFFEFSLCLSRACLGKKMTVVYKWLKKPVSPTGAERPLSNNATVCCLLTKKKNAKRLICQDRLGTNVGKLEANGVSAGTFYLAANCSADYTHCGARRGRTLFYWPADKTARSAPVVPRLFSLIEIRGARHVVLSNLTFRDTSYWSGGAWHNTGSTVRGNASVFLRCHLMAT